MPETQPWQPKRWLATLLSLVLFASGFIYLGKLRLAIKYWLVSLIVVLALFFGLGEVYASFANFAMHILAAIHSYKIASNYQLSIARPWYTQTLGFIATLLTLLILLILPIFLLRAFVFEPFRIPANSMAPNFMAGDFIVISKWGYGNYGAYGINLLHTKPSKSLAHGDVVVFAYPPEPSIDYIKRIIGLPGDHISYKNKQLYVNSVLIELPSSAKPANLTIETPEKLNIAVTEVTEKMNKQTWHVFKTDNLLGQDFEVQLSTEQYFVLGDNRDNSSDSRYWGPVPAENIKGVVIYKSTR